MDVLDAVRDQIDDGHARILTRGAASVRSGMVAGRLRATGNATTLMALDAAQLQPLRVLIAKPNYLTTGRPRQHLEMAVFRRGHGIYVTAQEQVAARHRLSDLPVANLETPEAKPGAGCEPTRS
jgi:hypothetical protein